MGDITYTLEDADLDQCKRKALDDNGQMRYLVEFDLHIKLSDEAGLLNFQVMHEGKPCGTADLAFLYT